MKLLHKFTFRGNQESRKKLETIMADKGLNSYSVLFRNFIDKEFEKILRRKYNASN